jgi:AhpC/TSA family
MSVTIIYGDRPVSVASATAEGDNLWLSLDDLRATTGWEFKPQGVCLGEVCVPIPAGREADFVGADGKQCNLAALARQLNQPAVHDDAHAVWVFGEAASARDNVWQSLRAPDFTLPDLEGQWHSLSAYRGRKILLVSWASW